MGIHYTSVKLFHLKELNILIMINNTYSSVCCKLNGQVFIVVTLNTFNCRVQLQSYGTAQGTDLNCPAWTCLLAVLEGCWGS